MSDIKTDPSTMQPPRTGPRPSSWAQRSTATAVEVERQADADRGRRHVASTRSRRSVPSAGRAARSSMTFFFLLVTMVIFSLLAPGKFNTATNIQLLALNVSILTVVSVGTTFVIATAGHRPVDPVGHRARRGLRRQGAELHPRRRRDGRRRDRRPDEALVHPRGAGRLAARRADPRVSSTVSPSATCGSLRCSRPWARWGPASVSRCCCRTASTSRRTRSNPVATGELIPGLHNLILIAFSS